MFEGQRPDEKIIFILRKHPAVLFRSALLLTLTMLFPISAFIFFKFSWVFSYITILWLIAGGLYAIKTWTCYYNSQCILTNQRLISINQKGFFHKVVTETALSKIQDVSYEIKGFWPSMWDFGTIIVSIYPPAGQKIVLEAIEEPKKIQRQIIEIAKGDKTEEKSKKEKSDFWG